MRGQRNPRFPLTVRDRESWLWQPAVCEATASDAYLVGGRRDKPKQSGAAVCAEMTLLIVFLRRMVKGISLRHASLRNNCRPIEVCRDAEGASGSAFAVGAVADSVHRGQRVDGD